MSYVEKKFKSFKKLMATKNHSDQENVQSGQPVFISLFTEEKNPTRKKKEATKPQVRKKRTRKGKLTNILLTPKGEHSPNPWLSCAAANHHHPISQLAAQIQHLHGLSPKKAPRELSNFNRSSRERTPEMLISDITIFGSQEALTLLLLTITKFLQSGNTPLLPLQDTFGHQGPDSREALLYLPRQSPNSCSRETLHCFHCRTPLATKDLTARKHSFASPANQLGY